MRIKGRVKRFSSQKGYGFIRRLDDERTEDVFVHVSDLPRGVVDLTEGQVVSFEMCQTKKGDKATNILLEATG